MKQFYNFLILPTGLLIALFFAYCNSAESPSGMFPVADFTITNNECLAPCEVVFTNTSVGATSFSWDFGDGTPAVTQENPTHTYEVAGNYLVKLTATNNSGSDTETKSVQLKTITFRKVFGGMYFDNGNDVLQTQDSGYIFVGSTNSEGAGFDDVYLGKTDKFGNLLWKKTFGGINIDRGQSIQQTQDGGYILLGQTSSEGAGEADIYLVKTDSSGNLVWKKTFGGANVDYGTSVQQAQDGGYILLGQTSSEGAGGEDMLLLKTDNAGNLVWKKTLGGANIDYGNSLQQTQDGGYILLGVTRSEGAGLDDVFLVKTDNSGNLVWEKTFGGGFSDYGYSVQQTQDGGYILLGQTGSEGIGGYDMYLVKTDNSGNLVWKKTFGGTNEEVGNCIQQTQDGGYILLGKTKSEGEGKDDMYLVKTDNSGNLVWEKTFGGWHYDGGTSVQQTQDGGYILLGYNSSEGAGYNDFFLVKTDKDGNVH